MPPIIPNAPWWANAAVLVLAVALPSLVSHLATRAKLTTTAQDVREVKEQVKNSHSSNLRVDLDKASAAAHRTESYAADLAESMKALERSLERRYRLTEKRIEEALEDHHRDIKEVRADMSDCMSEHLEQHHKEK